MAKAKTKTAKKTNLGGRPTKYLTKYATLAFVDEYIKHCEEKEEFISICGLACYMNVCEDTLQEWKKVKAGFSVTCTRVKQLSKQMLLNQGLTGDYNSKVTILCLSANHGMAVKKEIEHSGAVELKPPHIE